MLHHRAGRLCNPNCSIRSHPLLYTRIYLCICVEHICCTFWIQICVKYICSTFWSVFVSHLVELVGIDLESNELHSFWCSYHLCFAYFPPCILSRFSVHCFKARTYETKYWCSVFFYFVWMPRCLQLDDGLGCSRKCFMTKHYSSCQQKSVPFGEIGELVGC